MEIYKDAIHFLLEEPGVKTWPELHHTITQAAHKPPIAWDFPVRACQAVGADPGRSLPAVAAITCAHMALILIDDLLDEDPRGAQLRIGPGRAANLALGLHTLAVRVLLNTKECRERERAAAALNNMMGETAFGQDLDVQNMRSEEDYWAVTRAKSSPYFGAALYIGALFGETPVETAEQLRGFGRLFGEIMQIHDDLNDCLASPANMDWSQGRLPLPILFAELVQHPDRDQFIALRTRVAEPEALKEAQSILVRCGAISYCVNELLSRQAKAHGLLGDIALADPTPLEQLLEHVIGPVKHLFASVGAEFVEAKT
jgi:geranylgeranyl diphosphate synthase type I